MNLNQLVKGMTEIRVPGMRQGASSSCIRDFPQGCGPHAVFVEQNPRADSFIENVPRLDQQNSGVNVVVADVGPSEIASAEVAGDSVTDGNSVAAKIRVPCVRDFPHGCGPSTVRGDSVVENELRLDQGKMGIDAVMDDAGQSQIGSVSAEVSGRVGTDECSRLPSELTLCEDKSESMNTGDQRPVQEVGTEVPADMFIDHEVKGIEGNETIGTAEEASTSFAVFDAVLESDKFKNDSLSSSKTSCEGVLVIDHQTVQIEHLPKLRVVADTSIDKIEKTDMDTANRDSHDVPVRSPAALSNSISLGSEMRMMVQPPEVGKGNDVAEQGDEIVCARPESVLRTETIGEPLCGNFLFIESHNEKNDCPCTPIAFGTKGLTRRGKIPARKSTNMPHENLHKSNTIMKRKSCDAHKDEQTRISEDIDSRKVDARERTLIVQALMVAENCPWRLGLRRGASSSRSAIAKAKVKKEKTSGAKKLVLDRTETEEDLTSQNAENEIAVVVSQQSNEHSITVPPISFAPVAFVNASVTPKIKVKREKKSNAKKLAINKVEKEDSTFRDAETENTLAVYQQSNDFSMTMPPETTTADLANGSRVSEDVTPRQKVKRALKLFNTIYRKLLHQEESKSKNSVMKRSDLAAAEKMKELGAFVNKSSGGIVGDVPGVEVGDEFGCRVELAVVGLHRIYQAGIDSVKRDGISIAASVVSTEGYADDMETLDVITYTGSGGKPASADREAENQRLTHGNLALKNSISARTPVRVIYGYKEFKEGIYYSNKKPKAVSTFTYVGLYHVEDYRQVQGDDDFLVFKFKLVRIPGQPELALDLVKKSTKSKVRDGQCVSDISEGKEKSPICAINTEGNDHPQPFKYITKMKYPSSYDIAPAKGCDCIGGCKDSGKCSCALKNGGEIPYNINGAIVLAKRLVYECGPSCNCSKSCTNRVSQYGIKIPLEIFKTKSMGWGVRSLSSITSGTFICEYIGELIEDKEAEKRNNDEYFFDIGNNYEDNSLWEGIPGVTPSPEPCPSPTDNGGGFTIDALEYGNVGRFINHSCTPNLFAQTVLYDHDDKRIPHIMFFASENIPPLQELTYHYNYAIDSVHDDKGNIKRKDCYCGSAECTGRLY